MIERWFEATTRFEVAYLLAVGAFVAIVVLIFVAPWAWDLIRSVPRRLLSVTRDRRVRQAAKKWGIMLLLILTPTAFAIGTMLVTDPPQTGGVCSLEQQEARRLDIAHETGTMPIAYTERGCQR